MKRNELFTTDFNCLTDFDMIILNVLSKTKDLKWNRKIKGIHRKKNQRFYKKIKKTKQVF
jgi:hypothetical protein